MLRVIQINLLSFFYSQLLLGKSNMFSNRENLTVSLLSLFKICGAGRKHYA
jgi:hypothetical protein